MSGLYRSGAILLGMRKTLLLTLLLAVAFASHAQEAAPSAGSHPYTLHVYANLMQVPTLVLRHDTEPVPGLERSRFTLSIDDGPPFTPTHVRMEGEDPLEMAILLDASGDENNLLRAFPDALASVAPDLRATDHVGLYAVDCRLIHSLDQGPTTADKLKRDSEAVLAAPTLHGTKRKSACADKVPLWGSVSAISTSLSQAPARRVLLVVSEGYNGRGHVTLRQLENLEATTGVAVFIIRDADVHRERSHITSSESERLAVIDADLQDIGTLADASGGTEFDIHPDQLPRTLHQFITMLRGRYILSFPRPQNPSPGIHGLDVSIRGFTGIIRPAGDSAPLPDPALAADPTTVTTAASPAIIGKSRAQR